MKQTFFLYQLLIVFALVISSCNSNNENKTVKHFSDNVLNELIATASRQQSRTNAVHRLDSITATFPFTSAVDKYDYYNSKRQLIELIHTTDRSYDTAISYIDSMIAVIEDNRLEKDLDQEYANCFSIRGEYYIRIRRYDKAISDIEFCRQLNAQAGDSCLMAENTKALGSIAIKQSDFPKAANLLVEALSLAKACKYDEQQFRRMQRYLDDLGYIYGSQRKYDSALMYHLAAIKFIEENKHLMASDTLFPYTALENIYQNIGIEYGKQNKLPESETYLKKAMQIDAMNLHDSLHLAEAQYWLGSFYLQSGRNDEAKEMAQKASLQMANFAPGFRARLLQLKIGIAKEKNQLKEEAAYRTQYSALTDSINSATNEILKKDPFLQYEQIDKKYQVALLKKDYRNQKNKTQSATVIGILLTLLAALFLFFLWRLRTVVKKRAVLYEMLKKTMDEKEVAEKQLREKELISQEISMQMEFNDAIVQDRAKISDDMHDELCSSLAALKFYVEGIKMSEAGMEEEKALDIISNEVSSIYQSARSYMHNLKTNNRDVAFSLTDFLHEIQQKFTEKGLMKVVLNQDEESIKRSLTVVQHHELYHIIKESISNVIKHANATELSISILFNAGRCEFRVADNGKGYEPENVVFGIGLNSITRRARSLDGDIDISSSPSGTIIQGYFYLQHKHVG